MKNGTQQSDERVNATVTHHLQKTKDPWIDFYLPEQLYTVQQCMRGVAIILKHPVRSGFKISGIWGN